MFLVFLNGGFCSSLQTDEAQGFFWFFLIGGSQRWQFGRKMKSACQAEELSSFHETNCEWNWKRKAHLLNFTAFRYVHKTQNLEDKKMKDFHQRNWFHVFPFEKVLFCGGFDGLRLLKWPTKLQKQPDLHHTNWNIDLKLEGLNPKRDKSIWPSGLWSRTPHPGWFPPHCEHSPVLPKRFCCSLVLYWKIQVLAYFFYCCLK